MAAKAVLLAGASTALLAAMPAAAQQQQREAVGLEEIIVTAQRRAQKVQDVPIALSAFSASDLDSRQIHETLDLMKFIP
ncbi:MAG: TonB-dependent receptor, partial [Alphaproteobacteria bacterium]